MTWTAVRSPHVDGLQWCRHCSDCHSSKCIRWRRPDARLQQCCVDVVRVMLRCYWQQSGVVRSNWIRLQRTPHRIDFCAGWLISGAQSYSCRNALGFCSTYSSSQTTWWTEDLVRLIGAVVCLLAVPRAQLFAGANNGWPHSSVL